jgi:arylsulfatase A-like enzyme
MTSRRPSVLGLLLPLLLGSGCAAHHRPNVIVVIADQWRAQAFGYAGDPNAKTPHIDDLARHSVRMVNAVSSVPVCTPTRASFLTGQRALTHGLFMNDAPLDPDAVSIAKVMKAAGYDTGIVGKWHVDGHGRSAYIPPERRQGFDYWKVLECTHDYNKSFYYADGPEKLKWDGYDAIAQTKDAGRYVHDHAKGDKPFLLFLAWGPPHDPYLTAPQRYKDQFDPAKLELRPNVPENIRAEQRKRAAGYYAHGAALDDCLGDLRRAIRAAGIEDDTLLIFASDHGDLLGSHGAYNKQQPYDESVRVPLMFHWPERLGDGGRDDLAAFGSPDLMPTILGLCGIDIPKTVEGLDFSDRLTHADAPDPSGGAALLACPAPFGQFNRLLGGREYRAVRTARYTYARDLKGPWLLFDNQSDPYQMTNLAGRPEHADLQGQLDALLNLKLAEAHDDFRPAGEYIAKWGYKTDRTGTIPYAN